MTNPMRIAVGVSGGGRSLANLLAFQDKHLFKVVGVIASSSLCGAVKIAEAADLPVFTDDFRRPDDGLARRMTDWLAAHRVDLVALAGFLKKFPNLDGWDRKVINIHPALLPKYGGKGMYGRNVHQAVIAAGDRVSGATIHFVNDEYDRGELLAQIQVKVAQDADADQLAQAVFASECKLYPAVLDDLARGVLPLESGVKIYEA